MSGVLSPPLAAVGAGVADGVWPGAASLEGNVAVAVDGFSSGCAAAGDCDVGGGDSTATAGGELVAGFAAVGEAAGFEQPITKKQVAANHNRGLAEIHAARSFITSSILKSPNRMSCASRGGGKRGVYQAGG